MRIVDSLTVYFPKIKIKYFHFKEGSNYLSWLQAFSCNLGYSERMTRVIASHEFSKSCWCS